MAVKVMVVEDQGIVANDVRMRLTKIGYEVTGVCLSGEEALAHITTNTPDIILMDIMLGEGIDGIETSGRIRETRDTPIIFLTAYEDEGTLARAKKVNPSGYILKPFDERDLRTAIEIALNNYRMEAKLRESERRFRVLAQEISDAVTVYAGNTLVWANDAFEKLTGHKPQDLVGGLEPIIAEVEWLMFSKRLGYWMEDKDIFNHHETVLATKAGRMVYADVTAKRIEFDGRDSLLLVFRDISSRKRLEKDLRMMKDSLQGEVEKTGAQLATAKERLEYSEKVAALGTLAMGTEFRQQISKIQGALASVRKKGGDAVKADCDALESSFAYVHHIFGSFSALTDSLALKKDDVDISDVLLVGVERFAFPKEITVKTDVPVDLPFVPGDREKIDFVFACLYDRAAKAVQGKGTVTLSAFPEDGWVVAELEDTAAAPLKGGLDLPIATLLVEAHGGDLELEMLPKGSRVTVRLPQRPEGDDVFA